MKGYGSDVVVAELRLGVYADSDAAVLDIANRLVRELEPFDPTSTEIDAGGDDDTYEVVLSFVLAATGECIATDLRDVVLPLMDRLGLGPECFELDGSGLATVGYTLTDFVWTTTLRPACYRAELGAWHGDAVRFEAVPLIPEYPDPPFTDEDLR